MVGAAGGSGSGGAAGGGSGGAGGGGGTGAATAGVVSGVQVQAVAGTDTANAIIVDGDAVVIDEDGPPAKRVKKCTSDVWNYFNKKTVIIEDNGKVYEQHWAFCNYEKCKFKGRCESNYGTTGFGHI